MSIFSDTATFLQGEFDNALIDTITTARTTAAGALNTTTGVIAAPTTSTPLSAVGALILFGRAEEFQFGEEATDRDEYTMFVTKDTDILRDDRVTVDASVLDADLVGDVLVVKSVDQSSHKARKAALCELET